MRTGVRIIATTSAVVLGAVAQAATAAPGLGRMPEGAFVALAVGSAIVLWGQLCVLSWATGPDGWRGPLLGWSGAVVLAGIGVGIVAPWLLPVVVVAGLCVLPAAAAGRRAASGFSVFRRRPVRAAVATIAVLVAVSLVWLVALLTGFFVTGAAGAFATWLWSGVVATGLLAWWARLGAPESARPPARTEVTGRR